MDYKNPSFDPPALLTHIKSGSYKISDLQWRFIVTAKHSLIVNHTECLIQLKLQLQGQHKQNKKNVHLQLSMSEFNELFREMQKINSMLSIIN